MAIDGQRGFFRDICLDENGLLCGIQELINGISQLTDIVSDNTVAIQDITVGINSIGEDIIEINTNLSTLNDIVSNIDNTTSDINVTVNNIEECCNNISNGGGVSDCVTVNETVVCSIPARQCTVILKTRQQPSCIVTPRYVNIVSSTLMNGFIVMTDSRTEMANKKYYDFVSRKKRKDVSTIERRPPGCKPLWPIEDCLSLPKLVIGKGYVYPSGHYDIITPKSYIDPKGKVVNVKDSYRVGRPNYSITFKG
jgi:hypothetical protein